MDFTEKFQQFQGVVNKRQSAIEVKLQSLDQKREELTGKIESLSRDAVRAELDNDEKALAPLNKALEKAQSELSSLGSRRSAYQSVMDDPQQFDKEAEALVKDAIKAYRENYEISVKTGEVIKQTEAELAAVTKKLNEKIDSLKHTAYVARLDQSAISTKLSGKHAYIVHIVGSPEDPRQPRTQPTGTLLRSGNQLVYPEEPLSPWKPSPEDLRRHVEDYIRSQAMK